MRSEIGLRAKYIVGQYWEFERRAYRCTSHAKGKYILHPVKGQRNPRGRGNRLKPLQISPGSVGIAIHYLPIHQILPLLPDEENYVGKAILTYGPKRRRRFLKILVKAITDQSPITPTLLAEDPDIDINRPTAFRDLESMSQAGLLSQGGKPGSNGYRYTLSPLFPEHERHIIMAGVTPSTPLNSVQKGEMVCTV